ncbi:gamma-glutamylcyclotransferase family protein [Novispirillum itersonii]|uniref:gamma-glutamylcyclotransferase family protein n=1 Tax=Novispirillum itersonii TaxID=189 RepID=UPI00036D41AF|nr:gamma-glutamylcyclotransferase family protein [Novispirillum itersonii]
MPTLLPPDPLSTAALHAANDDATAPVTLPLFVFGSLMDADILARVLGRRRAAAVVRCPAWLSGYRRQCAREDVFPILVPDTHTVAADEAIAHPPVEGRLLLGLTAGDLDRIEYYEGAGYVLRPLTVEIPLTAGQTETPETEAGPGACPGEGRAEARRRTGAQVFLSTGLFSDSGVAWDIGHWQQTQKRYALLLTDALMQHYGVTPKEDMEGPVWAAIEARCRDLLAEEDAVFLSAR